MDWKFEKKKSKVSGKKIILFTGTVALFSMAFVVWPVVFKKNHFERVVDDYGDIQLEGMEDYHTVSNYQVLLVQTVIGNEEIRLADVKYKSYDNDFWTLGYVYEDVITGKQLCRFDEAQQENTTVLNSERLQDYLIAFGKVKAFYTPEDIEEILDLLEEYCIEPEKKNEKELTKS